MSDIGMFAPRVAGFTRVASATWPGVALKDVEHIGGNRFLVADNSDGGFLPVRLFLATYQGSSVSLVRTIYSSGGVADTARGVFLDGMSPVLLLTISGVGDEYRKLHWNGGLVSPIVLGGTQRGVCWTGTRHYRCVSGSATLLQAYRVGSTAATTRSITIPAAATGVAFDGKHLWTVSGNSSVRQLDLNGNLIRLHQERTAFNPTSITYVDHGHFVCGNG